MRKTIRKFKETIEIQSSLFNRIKSHRYFSIIAFSLVFLVVACFHIWQRVRVLELVKEVSILQEHNETLNDYLKKNKSLISRLSLSSRIEKYATDTLGMKTISADKLYTLSSDKFNETQPDDLVEMLSTIKRVAEFIPVISESKAMADELQIVKPDSSFLGHSR